MSVSIDGSYGYNKLKVGKYNITDVLKENINNIHDLSQTQNLPTQQINTLQGQVQALSGVVDTNSTNIGALTTRITNEETNITALQTTVSAIPSKYVDLKTTQTIAGQKTFTDWCHFGPMDCVSIFHFDYIDFRRNRQ